MQNFRNDIDFRDFELRWPMLAEHVVECEQLNEWEMRLVLDDGKVIVYNDDTLQFRYVKNVEQQPMSEETWRSIFARVLSDKMHARRLTQQELADIAGLSQVVVGKYLNGKVTPSTYTLRKLAKALGCSPLELTEFPTY